MEIRWNVYKIGFEAGGLVLFAVIMLPNFLWFAVPTPNDVLRRESITPTLYGKKYPSKKANGYEI